MGEVGEGWGVDWASDTFFVTDGQKRDYLSRASHALLRGVATKKLTVELACSYTLQIKLRGRLKRPTFQQINVYRLQLIHCANGEGSIEDRMEKAVVVVVVYSNDKYNISR